MNWYFDRILQISFDRLGEGRTVKDGLIRKFCYIQEEFLFFRASFAMDTQNNLREHDFRMILEFYTNLIREKSGKMPDEMIRNV